MNKHVIRNERGELIYIEDGFNAGESSIIRSAMSELGNELFLAKGRENKSCMYVDTSQSNGQNIVITVFGEYALQITRTPEMEVLSNHPEYKQIRFKRRIFSIYGHSFLEDKV